MTLIAARGLSVAHGGQAAVRGVDIAVEPGEIVAVIGPNGAGKSTLIRALFGELAPIAGTVTRRAGLRLGYVPQRLSVVTHVPITVRRFLSLPERRGDEEARAALARTGVTGLERRQLWSLSGGQFQRVALARALLAGPDILILDEPTQGLDRSGSADFFQLVRELRRDTGCSALLVSHDLPAVMDTADRVLCLDGRVRVEGTPAAVAAAPEYRALFGHAAAGAPVAGLDAVARSA